MTYSIELQNDYFNVRNENNYFYVRVDPISGADFIISLHPKICGWLIENVSEFYITYSHYNDKIISLVLDSEEDAVAFKLRWL